jgi:hypothetical protein
MIGVDLKNQLLSQTFTESIMFLFHFEFQNAETIEKLNESGELRRILKPFKVSNSIKILYTVRTSMYSSVFIFLLTNKHKVYLVP